ncbi:hypothetical protein KKF81_00965 [Candidatus Micrarchaeota archaeon]|nr:hypothetical protein [Candidatus Micrarchaeota archaeon]MBU1886328.1 hypothetical protein [Candidatus Micrarchaeota archaeon]
MKQDNQLKEAIEECAKIVEEKCDKRPYMIIIVKTDVGYNSEEDKKKGILKGMSSYMYSAKPALKKDGLSKLLIDTSKMAISLAEKKINDAEPEPKKV